MKMMLLRGIGLGTSALVFLLDQWSKNIVLLWATQGQLPLSPTSFLNIILTKNKGISFGLLQAGSAHEVLALILVAGVISFFLGLWVWQSESLLPSLCFGAVLGGALGNVMDRYLYGAVVDFIDLHVSGYHWYTFNIADGAIVLGIFCLFLGLLISDPPHPSST